MIELHSQLSSPSRMVFHRLLPCLVSLVILFPGSSALAYDRGDERDEDEEEFSREYRGPRICSNTAQTAFNACEYDSKDNFWIPTENA